MHTEEVGRKRLESEKRKVERRGGREEEKKGRGAN
jgi:hypothetical protein